jgi:nucleotide-binding universal stress UspA family protein
VVGRFSSYRTGCRSAGSISVLIACEAKRAVHDAMPLIASAGVVTVVSVDVAQEDQEITADLIDHLKRYGLHPFCETLESGLLTVTHILLGRAKKGGANVIVMGAYKHSRLSESILGGVTHDMLRDMIRPVLISH